MLAIKKLIKVFADFIFGIYLRLLPHMYANMLKIYFLFFWIQLLYLLAIPRWYYIAQLAFTWSRSTIKAPE